MARAGWRRGRDKDSGQARDRARGRGRFQLMPTPAIPLTPSLPSHISSLLSSPLSSHLPPPLLLSASPLPFRHLFSWRGWISTMPLKPATPPSSSNLDFEFPGRWLGGCQPTGAARIAERGLRSGLRASHRMDAGGNAWETPARAPCRQLRRCPLSCSCSLAPAPCPWFLAVAVALLLHHSTNHFDDVLVLLLVAR